MRIRNVESEDPDPTIIIGYGSRLDKAKFFLRLCNRLYPFAIFRDIRIYTIRIILAIKNKFPDPAHLLYTMGQVTASWTHSTSGSDPEIPCTLQIAL